LGQGAILRGIAQRKGLRRFVTIGNQVKEKTIHYMRKCLDRDNPNNKLQLDEFWVAHCKANPQAIYDLISLFRPERVLKDSSGGTGQEVVVDNQITESSIGDVAPFIHETINSTEEESGAPPVHRLKVPSVRKLGIVGIISNERQF
jgi:hypothetical protein